jgi:hypothetical protein
MKPGLLKDITILGCAVVLVAFLLIGFHRCTALGKGLSVDGYAIVGTTLFAAALGFGAVMLQLRDQRRAADEEQRRQKRAVAAAISAEIDDFYTFFLKAFWERQVRSWIPTSWLLMPPPELGPLPSTALVVYRSTAHQLGILSAATVKCVVGLYNFTASFVEHYEMYRRVWSPSSNFTMDPELATKLRDAFDAVPQLILQSYRASEMLAKEQERTFDESGFSIAGIDKTNEGGETMRQVLERKAADVRARVSKGG